MRKSSSKPQELASQTHEQALGVVIESLNVILSKGWGRVTVSVRRGRIVLIETSETHIFEETE